MKAILIDDEPIAIEVLNRMLEFYKDLKVVGSYTNPLEALKEINKLKPDIVFLDIEMGDTNGIEIGEIILKTNPYTEIVFITAYSEYAIDAFEINAIDYLLKPIQENRLFKAIERVKESIEKNKGRIQEVNQNKLQVYSFGEFRVINNNGYSLTWRTRKAKELFAYLWLRGEKPSHRDLIIENIFPDRSLEKSITLLHTTIYQIRKNLKSLGFENGLIYSNESYSLNIEIISDLEELEGIVGKGSCNDENILEIQEICNGEFLEENYPWAIGLQQKYRHIILDYMKQFIEKNIENNQFSKSLRYAIYKSNELDPFDENTVKMTIYYYGNQNKIKELKDYFKYYKKQLWEEIRQKPTKTIINIYNSYI